MKNIKIVELPKEVLEKAKIVGNIFDKIGKQNERYEGVICELINLLRDKYGMTSEQWNSDVAPILRKYIKL